MSPRRARVAVAVLAAGASTRMGEKVCKLALPFADTTLLARALDAARSSRTDAAFAVLGAHREQTAPIAAACEVRAIVNPAWEQGQATSVALAAAVAKREGFDGLLLLVADQPFVDTRCIDTLVDAFRTDVSAAGRAYVASAGGRRGNPCLFGSGLFDELTRLTGDEGARRVLRARPEAAVAVEVGDPRVFEDADTPQAFARLEALYAQADAARRRCDDEGGDAPCPRRLPS